MAFSQRLERRRYTLRIILIMSTSIESPLYVHDTFNVAKKRSRVQERGCLRR
jgi:hypothetical protein